MLEAFYLWYIYALLAYRDILRPAGSMYIPIYKKEQKYTIDKMPQGLIGFLLCLECQKKKFVYHIFCELCE